MSVDFLCCKRRKEGNSTLCGIFPSSFRSNSFWVEYFSQSHNWSSTFCAITKSQTARSCRETITIIQNDVNIKTSSIWKNVKYNVLLKHCTRAWDHPSCTDLTKTKTQHNGETVYLLREDARGLGLKYGHGSLNGSTEIRMVNFMRLLI